MTAGQEEPRCNNFTDKNYYLSLFCYLFIDCLRKYTKRLVEPVVFVLREKRLFQ